MHDFCEIFEVRLDNMTGIGGGIDQVEARNRRQV